MDRAETAALIRHALARVPLSRSVRRRLKRWRDHLGRLVGSDRYDWSALYDMDRRLVEVFEGRTDGRFLEIGANDGLQQSNTLALARRFGWTGILVEANPALATECRRNRPESDTICAVALARPGLARIGDDDLMAQVGSHSGIVVAGVTLTMILDASCGSHLDLMSIDVEGAELELLAGLDLDRHSPEYILIETSQVSAVDSILGDHHERIEQLSYHDYLYRRLEIGSR